MRRFSKEELIAARNSIPMREVVIEMSGLPNKDVETVFRFLCPVCGEFQTGVHEKANLARCFLCCRNFNAIELLMESRHITFVESVKLLLHRLSADGTVPPRHYQPSVPVRSSSSVAARCGTTSKAEASAPDRSLLSAASILARMRAS